MKTEHDNIHYAQLAPQNRHFSICQHCQSITNLHNPRLALFLFLFVSKLDLSYYK